MREEKKNTAILPDEIISKKIYLIRGQKVMLDRDLAELYNVETRILNQAVRRNVKRFPKDFMFQMNSEEYQNWKSQIVISNSEKMSLRRPPLVFTEQGVAMLSSILKSDAAILVNIQIIRVFTKIRKTLKTHEKILAKIDELERKGIEQDNKIVLIFKYIKQLEEVKKQDSDQKSRQQIGYKIPDKK